MLRHVSLLLLLATLLAACGGQQATAPTAAPTSAPAPTQIPTAESATAQPTKAATPAATAQPAEAAGTPAAAAEATQPAGACADGTRLFSHKLLSTAPLCIPVAPQRVVALDMASVEMTLLAHKTLVGSSNWIVNEMPLLSPQFADKFTNIENVGFPPDREKILALHPDIILASSGLDLGDIASVAPVVIADESIYSYWKLGSEFWSEVLNVPEIYTAMEQNYSARTAELATALGTPADTKVSVISASTYAIALWMPNTPVGNILHDVGLGRPEAQSLDDSAAMERYQAKQYIEISQERLDLVDGDAIFYFTYASPDPEVAGKESAFVKDLAEKPLWQTLKAVKAGKAFLVPAYWWRSQTYLHASKVIDDLFTDLTSTKATTPTLAEFPS